MPHFQINKLTYTATSRILAALESTAFSLSDEELHEQDTQMRIVELTVQPCIGPQPRFYPNPQTHLLLHQQLLLEICSILLVDVNSATP